MASGPRRATTRTASSSTACSRTFSRSAPGGTGTSRPSTFETTLDVTTTTSPSASQDAASAIAAARSSPGANSGSPATGTTARPLGSSAIGADASGVQGGPGQLRGGLGGAHEQRPLPDVDTGDVGHVVGRDQPGVEQPARGPAAVVPSHP